MRMTLNGLDETEAALRRIETGVRKMQDTQAVVGSKQPYAYGQEKGRHRKSGKLARRAGGYYYLRRGVQEVMANGTRDVAEGLTKVRAPGPWVLKRLGRWAKEGARRHAPVRTERLRRSIVYQVRAK